MNMNFKLDLDIKKWLPLIKKLQPYIFGLLLIAVFAYTAFTINSALNVKPDPTAVAPPSTAAKIVFDKATINSVKNLNVVQGDVPTGTLGKPDPFK
jgi:hypothetical protein